MHEYRIPIKLFDHTFWGLFSLSLSLSLNVTVTKCDLINQHRVEHSVVCIYVTEKELIDESQLD